MTDTISAGLARRALTELPEETTHADSPDLPQVYLPRSHLKAMDPNSMLITGMRGAGKTFWWNALQSSDVRQLVDQAMADSTLGKETEVRTGFGIRSAPNDYPDKDTLKKFLETGVEPRSIWRSVQAYQLARDDHPIRKQESWKARINYVDENPEKVAHLFLDRDTDLGKKGNYFLLLFDALDRCSDSWQDMYRLVKGLMQTALDMRSFKKLRVKIFLRSDQVGESRIADFPDASKIFSSAVELSWPAHELYGLLWHNLVNGSQGKEFRTFIGEENWKSIRIDQEELFSVVSKLTSDSDFQRDKFHGIAGPFMGKNRRRGFPYTWIPNHLGDTAGRVSPRSFLQALRKAAEDTTDRYPDHGHALHFESIKRGVQVASETRVREVKEDYPWFDKCLACLEGLTVPCEFEEIEERWKQESVLDNLGSSIDLNEIRLPPRDIDRGTEGVRKELESLKIFLRMRDNRVNIPDVFRVGYGLGRKGGVKAVR